MIALLHDLPDWARSLCRARGVRRLLQFYHKADRAGPATEIIEQIAREYETTVPDSERLVKLGRKVKLLAEELRPSAARDLLSSLETLCLSGYLGDVGLSELELPRAAVARISREERKADAALMWRTIYFEASALDNAASCADALKIFGSWTSLWPRGEPACVRTEWMSEAEEQSHIAHLWADDIPEPPQRPATLRSLAPGVSSEVASAMGPERFEMVFRAGDEVWDLHRDRDAPPLHALAPKRIRRNFTLRGYHAFRGPADADVQREIFAIVKDDPRFAAMIDFYRHHDGGLLFQCDQLGSQEPLANMYGLEDQDAARDLVRYTLDYQRMDEPGAHASVLAQYDTSLQEIVVVVESGSLFAIPLRGRFAGEMIRFYMRARRHAVWASTFVEGIFKIRERIHTIAPPDAHSVRLGDEALRGETILQLSRVKYT